MALHTKTVEEIEQFAIQGERVWDERVGNTPAELDGFTFTEIACFKRFYVNGYVAGLMAKRETDENRSK